MRRDPPRSDPDADHVILIGSSETALAALWSLAAAGAHVHWYTDRADVGAETVLARRLGHTRLTLSLDDPRLAPLDGVTAVVTARGDALDGQVAERARASQVPVHVAGRPDLSTIALSRLDGTAGAAAHWPADIPDTAWAPTVNALSTIKHALHRLRNPFKRSGRSTGMIGVTATLLCARVHDALDPGRSCARGRKRITPSAAN